MSERDAGTSDDGGGGGDHPQGGGTDNVPVCISQAERQHCRALMSLKFKFILLHFDSFIRNLN